MAGGCGNNPGDWGADRMLIADCGGGGTATDLVILDWSGGTSLIHPHKVFPGLDFSSFETADGGTLADQAEAFTDAVRREVVHILCAVPSVSLAVRSEKDRGDGGGTTVYLVQAPSQSGGGQIGEGEYDPCNLQHDNSALVFGDELLALPGQYSFDEWVHIFANVTAHEIGHALGFNHIPRSMSSETEHPIFVELMLAGHTVDEMVRPQRFLSNDTNCPNDVVRARHMGNGIIGCGIIE